MITEPIDCNEELKRVPRADYELCTALLTMLLGEDHFSNGSFERRFVDGQVPSCSGEDEGCFECRSVIL